MLNVLKTPSFNVHGNVSVEQKCVKLHILRVKISQNDTSQRYVQ